MLRLSAGGVVIGPDGKVIVVNQNGDSWSLPKGHVDEGETALQAAKREIHEESGVTELELVKKLGEYERPRISKGGQGDDATEIKRIAMFLFTTTQQDLEPIDPGNPRAEWLGVDQVADRLTHQKDKEFYESVQHELIAYLQQRA